MRCHAAVIEPLPLLHGPVAAGTCTLTSRHCRLLNEVPTVLLFVIVIMVVVKPVFS